MRIWQRMQPKGRRRKEALQSCTLTHSKNMDSVKNWYRICLLTILKNTVLMNLAKNKFSLYSSC